MVAGNEENSRSGDARILAHFCEEVPHQPEFIDARRVSEIARYNDARSSGIKISFGQKRIYFVYHSQAKATIHLTVVEAMHTYAPAVAFDVAKMNVRQVKDRLLIERLN